MYLGEKYLIKSKTGLILYKKYAKNMPIFDYHCHLNPKEIYENKPFANLTKAWLVEGHYGDHYKWRSMRANGVSEEYITGSRDDYEKFLKWAETVPYTIGNPLYTWTHMELKKYFGIDKELSPSTAKEIYDKAGLVLQTLTPRKMIEMNNVKVLCTTDDPIDSLEYHKLIKEDQSFNVKVLPAFRPDKAVNIELNWYNEWVDKLEDVVGRKLNDIDELCSALEERIEFFHKMGCRISDHALDTWTYLDCSIEDANEAYKLKRSGKTLSNDQINKYRSYMMVFFGRQYAKHSWAQQYHLCALRNNSERMLRLVGPDTGFDSINNGVDINALQKLMAKLDSTDELPKTILYSLNPNDNEALISLAGCFQNNTKGKIQLGSGWWFNDQKDGIKRQLTALASMGLISNFIGMLTDSRSFLSYPRHDYFRRIVCDFLGNLIDNHEYPNDIEFVGKIVQNICFGNAKDYFGVE